MKGSNSLKGSIENFGYIHLFVACTLLNIIAVYTLSLSITIFKIITKTLKFSKNYQFRGSHQTTGCLIGLKISGQIDFDLSNKFILVRFALNALVSEILAKNCILPYVLFLAMSAILVRRQGHRTHCFKLDTLMMIVDKFG